MADVTQIRLPGTSEAGSFLSGFTPAAGKALLQGDDFSRALVSALPAAIYTTDSQGRITYFNEAAAALWGYRPELGKSEWCGSWKLSAFFAAWKRSPSAQMAPGFPSSRSRL